MILLYHHVVPNSELPAYQNISDGWDFRVTPDGFERHIVYFKQNGYFFISLQELVAYIKKQGVAPKKTVTITFDDGWIDNFKFALPLLKSYEVPACFFITSSELVNVNGGAFEKKMSIDQLRQLMASGMEIGSHTQNHCILDSVSPDEAFLEISNSKAEIEQALGNKVDYFAYPGGAFNTDIVEMVKAAGYHAACTVIGPAPNDRSSLLWLYRTVLSENLDTRRDFFVMNSLLSKIIALRSRRRLSHQLTSNLGGTRL